MTLPIALLLSLAASATALSHVAVKRQISELDENYDFVIAGGGTAGLTIADRLTEAFPESKCHIFFFLLLLFFLSS